MFLVSTHSISDQCRFANSRCVRMDFVVFCLECCVALFCRYIFETSPACTRFWWSSSPFYCNFSSWNRDASTYFGTHAICRLCSHKKGKCSQKTSCTFSLAADCSQIFCLKKTFDYPTVGKVKLSTFSTAQSLYQLFCKTSERIMYLGQQKELLAKIMNQRQNLAIEHKVSLILEKHNVMFLGWKGMDGAGLRSTTELGNWESLMKEILSRRNLIFFQNTDNSLKNINFVASQHFHRHIPGNHFAHSTYTHTHTHTLTPVQVIRLYRNCGRSDHDWWPPARFFDFQDLCHLNFEPRGYLPKLHKARFWICVARTRASSWHPTFGRRYHWWKIQRNSRRALAETDRIFMPRNDLQSGKHFVVDVRVHSCHFLHFVMSPLEIQWLGGKGLFRFSEKVFKIYDFSFFPHGIC